MTPIEHKLPSGTMLIVPLKENKNLLRCEIPDGFEILGESTSISEQQLSGIMPTCNDNGLTKHFDYVKGYYSHSLFTALESFASLKQSKRIIDHNKYGTERPMPCYDVLWDAEGDELLDNWTEEQSKVRKYIVLFKTS